MGSTPTKTEQAVKQYTFKNHLVIPINSQSIQKGSGSGNSKELQNSPASKNFAEDMQNSAIRRSNYDIPQLHEVIAEAYKDMSSRDPIGKRRYFFKVINFIFEWIHRAMKEKGMTLFEAESHVNHDLIKACQDYPVGKLQDIECSIPNIKPSQMPDLAADLKIKTKESLTDRIKELGERSKQVSYEFNKTMQLILQKDGGYNFMASFKNTGTKAYMRIMTKIMDDFLSAEMGSKQVYEDMDHYYWTPIFERFNKIIDENTAKIKINLYDWIRCKASYHTIEDLEHAYERLKKNHGKDIFRVKNRINTHTRDILINLKFKTEYTQVQLALSYNSDAANFNHKLYELTRQKLGVAYCCYTFLMNEGNSHQVSVEGVMTPSGYFRRCLLREKIEVGFERATKSDVEKELKLVSRLLDKWDIVALKTGTIRGKGYESQVDTKPYGPQTEDMLLVKRKTRNHLIDWLNWMQ